jgi:superfamily I DNA/RNA helicase/mRNA-degrading endonuclease RelE of RelBE toxin-antitoxin system
MSHTLSMKEGFLSEWLALPAKEQTQVGTKLRALTADPRPDGVSKKQLVHVNREVCRLRSGDYRVFYTFDDRYVSLLKLVRRSEDTYEGDVDAEYFGGPGDFPEVPAVGAPLPTTRPVGAPAAVGPSGARALPEPITAQLLQRLLVPVANHQALMAAGDEDALLACQGVPDDVILRVHTALFERPLGTTFAEKELVAASVDDLFRYRDGDLMGFLLRLSAEQAKFEAWALEGSGPTLVKGGPGTGKSTVALYRTRAMLRSLKAAGIATPRVLFTTYTNALVTFSEQLLRSLLGDDAHFVDVRTADSIALSIVSGRMGAPRIASAQEQRDAMTAAMSAVKQTGSSLVKRSQADSLAKLGRDYLIDEINSVIEARRLATLDAYRAAKRPGRRVPLGESQRSQVWALREAFNRELKRLGKMTFHQVRAYAAELVAQGHGPEPYDAVIVDEAQDLDPSLLWILASLAKSPGRVFLTADADQSIYGSGFRWSDVHDDLRFTGRTGVLRANFRSTREIGEAARDYLADGRLDDEPVDPEYVHAGPLPAIRFVGGEADEAALLKRFFKDAARELRLPVWAGAILVPSEKAGERLAARLSADGLPAKFMTGRDLELTAQALKVITLKSAKGLEFPAVAIAGFDQPYPYLRAGMSDDERAERMSQERRTLYVAMTRAMRALLVCGPRDGKSPLVTGVNEELWNVDRSV